MLGLAGLAAAVLIYSFVGGEIEVTFAFVLATTIVVGLCGGVTLLALASTSTGNAAAFSWAAPGIMALVPFVGAGLQRSFDSPLGLGGLLGATSLWSAGAGVVAPITSLAATAVARRSKRRAHVLVAALSWLGSLVFWGRVSGLFLQDW